MKTSKPSTEEPFDPPAYEPSSATLTTDDPNTLTERFNSVLREIIDKHAPLKKKKVHDRPNAPCITNNVKRAKQERRKAERKWRRTRLPQDRLNYKKSRDDVIKLIETEKEHYLSSKIKDCRTSKALFDVCNELSGKTKTSVLPTNIAFDDLPETFVKYFITKVADIREGLDSSSSKNTATDNYEMTSV